MISKSGRETIEIAKTFLTKLLKNSRHEGALVVGLSGDLGAGKTAFVKAVAKHLKIKNKVFSPTYVIMKKYFLPRPRGSAPTKVGARGSNYKFFYHIDAYRLKNEKELIHLGWKEIISDKENLVFVEWPENISKAMPSNAKYVYITHTKNGHRDFKLK